MRLGHFARLFGLVGIAVTCFVRPQPVSAATIISTVPAWDGINSFGDFGKSGFSGWGQSFTVPADAHLDTFTFYLKSHDLQDTPVTYSMHLYPFH
jgi:hypothetical protein